MSLAQITEKIERDARDEAERILARAREQEAEIKKDTDSEVKKLEDAGRARFDKERPEIFRRRDIVASLDVKKDRLKAERKLIAEVFAEGLERLKKLDREEYLKFNGQLLKGAVQGGDEIILFSSGEKYLTPEWVDKFNKANSTRITVSGDPGNFTGGFILSNGRIRINCTFEMLIQVAQERLESEVVHRLFSD